VVGDDAGDELTDRGLVGDVGRPGHGAARPSAELCDGHVDRRRVDVVDDDGRALVDEPLGRRPPDAARCTRDDRDAALEPLRRRRRHAWNSGLRAFSLMTVIFENRHPCPGSRRNSKMYPPSCSPRRNAGTSPSLTTSE
jgi:hypothetical protein